ncbi:MAG: DUF4249 family protein [Candidatus Delongbacteria bacterium]|jgi:hypothetical protein|nr:DUF4249 family protein [Candidatus Delongbacteria bacterium]
MKNTIIILLSIILLLSFTSCENGESTDYDETMVMYLFAQADSTISELYLSRTATVNESITMENLGISGATIELYEKAPDSLLFTEIGTLQEYEDTPGIYYLDSTVFSGGFKEGYRYRVEAYHSGYTSVSAQTICPPPLTNIVVSNPETLLPILSIDQAPTIIDTLLYRRGESIFDNEMFKCNFDPSLLLQEERLASYTIIPDDTLKSNQDFWLEDTTKVNWEDYELYVKMFKSKKKYGEDLVDYNILDITIAWRQFYHEGLHTIVFSSTDNVMREFQASGAHGGTDIYSNVENGFGLFTIGNSSGDNSRYRVYVKSLEERLP